MNTAVLDSSGERVIPPGIMALYRELQAREQGLLGPELRISQKEVNAFTSLTGDINPLHRGGENRFGERPILPGLMITSLIPRLAGIDFPFELDGMSLINRRIECDFRFPIEVDAPVRMRFHPLSEPKVLIGVSIDIGFAVILVRSGKEAVRGMIRLGYV